MTIRTQIRKLRNKVWIYFVKRNNIGSKDTIEFLKVGETVLIEGGEHTKKNQIIESTERRLKLQGANCIYINGSLPLGDWVKQCKIFGKNLDGRINYYLAHLPNNFYLIINYAEKVTETKKLEFVSVLLDKAKSTIIGVNHRQNLNQRLLYRFANCKIYHLGSGNSDTFDCTMFLIGAIVISIAIMGLYNMLFVAIAMRIIFMGLRIGGRKI